MLLVLHSWNEQYLKLKDAEIIESMCSFTFLALTLFESVNL
jgi:hypothetical protein